MTMITNTASLEIQAQDKDIAETELYLSLYSKWDCTRLQSYIQIAEHYKAAGDLGHPVIHKMKIGEIKELIEKFMAGYIPHLSIGKKACRCQVETIINEDQESCSYCE